MGNGLRGIAINQGDENIVGGDRTQDESNLIVANGSSGIYVGNAAETKIRGNLIGITADGQTMGNGGSGIELENADLNQVGEASAGETGNLIPDNADEGILITATSPGLSAGNIIAANSIGRIILNDGTIIKESNGKSGVADSGDKTIIGGNGSDDGNTFDGNGIELHGSEALVRRNRLNSIDGDCIRVTGSQNSIGGPTFLEGNFLTGCDGVGIAIEGSSAIENAIAVNSMRFVSGPGIDLGADGLDGNDAGDGDTGPNDRQNSPQVTDADYDYSQQELTVTYLVDSDAAHSNYDLQIRFFRNSGALNKPQGYSFLGSDNYALSNAGSEVTITLSITADHLKEGDLIATATDADGNTSEFSRPVRYGGIFHDRFE